MIFQFTTQMETLGAPAQVDWRLVPAGILVLFALWILAALALACSTRLDTIPTLAICSAFFLLGLMSDYFFGHPAEAGIGGLRRFTASFRTGSFSGSRTPWTWAKAPFTGVMSARRLATRSAYAGAALAVGTALFEERELKLKRIERFAIINDYITFNKWNATFKKTVW